MKKKNWILWVPAIIIVLVAGSLNSITSSDYPVSGTIGADGKKVTYYFERNVQAGNDYRVLIRTDNPEITGYLEMRNSRTDSILRRDLVKGEGILESMVPGGASGDSLFLDVYIKLRDSVFQVPKETTLSIFVTGKIPIGISILYSVTLFAFLLFAVRTALESFNPKPHYTRFVLYTAISTILYSLFVLPIYNYFYGRAGESDIMSPERLFSFEAWYFPLIWFLAFAALSVIKDKRFILLTAGILTLGYFIIFH